MSIAVVGGARCSFGLRKSCKLYRTMAPCTRRVHTYIQLYSHLFTVGVVSRKVQTAKIRLPGSNKEEPMKPHNGEKECRPWNDCIVATLPLACKKNVGDAHAAVRRRAAGSGRIPSMIPSCRTISKRARRSRCACWWSPRPPGRASLRSNVGRSRGRWRWRAAQHPARQARGMAPGPARSGPRSAKNKEEKIAISDTAVTE